MEPLPPPVTIDLERDDLRAYWLARARQHTQDTYAGVPLSKFPEDLRVYEHLLWRLRPDTVIEIGTQWGGSALWFRDRLRALRAYGRIDRAPHVVSVDLDQSTARARLAEVDPAFAEEITLLDGDVTDPALPDAVAARLRDGARCLVVEDSAHVDGHDGGGARGVRPVRPRPAGSSSSRTAASTSRPCARRPAGPAACCPRWRRGWHSPAGADFAVRRDLELYGITCHPHGFLQRRGGEAEPARPALPAAIVREQVDGPG